jgi:transposase InsO family protein
MRRSGFSSPARRTQRARGTRAPLTLSQGPNQRLSLDFVSDKRTDSRQFRILAVVDDFTRECIVLVADTSPRSVVSLMQRSPDEGGQR